MINVFTGSQALSMAAALKRDAHWSAGYNTFFAGGLIKHCAWANGTKEYESWVAGYEEARRESGME